jgi:hypothetical protein
MMYRLALCFVAILCIVGLVVARQEAVNAQGGAAQMIREHNATVRSMQAVVTVVLTPTPKPTLIPLYEPPCCYQNFDFGNLWNKYDPRAYVFVVGMSHDEYPLTEEQANDWLSRGEGCYADAGSQFVRTRKNPNNDFGIGIRLLSGNCMEFEGWVSMSVVSYRLMNPVEIRPLDSGG